MLGGSCKYVLHSPFLFTALMLCPDLQKLIGLKNITLVHPFYVIMYTFSSFTPNVSAVGTMLLIEYGHGTHSRIFFIVINLVMEFVTLHAIMISSYHLHFSLVFPLLEGICDESMQRYNSGEQYVFHSSCVVIFHKLQMFWFLEIECFKFQFIFLLSLSSHTGHYDLLLLFLEFL